MTEREWLESTDPQTMLEFLRGKASDRKLRLFACSSCHRVARLLPDDASRSALATCERFADGLASAVELQEARQAAISSYDTFQDTDEFGNFTGAESASAAVAGACWISDANDCYRGLDAVIDNAFGLGRLYTGWRNGGQIELRRQCRSLRDVFGNPFRRVTLSPAVLAWNDGVVFQLAKAAYEERIMPEGTLDTCLLAILADALEEAGCTDEDILGHLRRPGPHVRGCWPVNLCLGKS